ncbi:nucleoside/nucleotide kinase family protein [Mycetocola spongiae]|uniref:nucleoside/nucleotide kinase family protein n=1 Tax=Mycetocola spongiae TaxID=2859226 RepID=UPI001CF11B37|nr:nucleoside/nucleotide kinase family protein [Mycetocola spongiae]
MSAIPRVDVTGEELVEWAAELAQAGQRRILGITGSPGVGKSTVAAELVAALGDRAALVGMDGFHLSGRVLNDLGRADRKGAPDTFDARGYLALLDRLRLARETVYVPAFDRGLEESIAAAEGISPEVPLIITEGNYLLLESPDWVDVRGRLDEVWFLRVPEELRRTRLIARHERYGRSPEEAAAWALGSDERNARAVEESRHRADLIITPRVHSGV